MTVVMIIFQAHSINKRPYNLALLTQDEREG